VDDALGPGGEVGAFGEERVDGIADCRLRIADWSGEGAGLGKQITQSERAEPHATALEHLAAGQEAVADIGAVIVKRHLRSLENKS
jgi:hypothetical protein